MRYYIQEQNRVAGPYSLDEIQAKVQRGELKATDSVCAEGSNVWTPLPSVTGAPAQPPPNYSNASATLPGAAPTPAAAVAPPPPKKGGGCCGCFLTGLVVLVVLVIALVGSGYYMLLYTAVPLRWIADKAAPAVIIKGVSGSIASGIAVQSIEWHSPDGQMCDVEDVRFKYNGLSDFGATKQIIINEINVGKAHLVVSTSPNANYEYNHGSSPTNQPAGPSPVKLFRIERVHFGDVYFKDLRTGFEISVPALDYTGFEVKDGQVELGSLQLQSDRLDLQTKPGVTVQIDGKPVVFQKRIEGTAKPLLSHSIKKPISFALDVGLTPEHDGFFHLTSFENKLDFYCGADHSSRLQAKGLPLAAYLSIAPYDAPAKVTFDLTSPAPTPGVTITPSFKGDFVLGVTHFVIDPMAPPADGTAKDRMEFTATGHAGEDQLVAAVTLQSAEPQAKFAFRSIPEMPPKELLAKIFFGHAYAELAEPQQKQVDAKVPVYFRAPGAAKP